jgi:hypothetical protein
MTINQFIESYKTVFYNITIVLFSLVFVRISLAIVIALLQYILRLIEEKNKRETLLKQDISSEIENESNVVLNSNQSDCPNRNVNNNNNNNKSNFTMELRKNRCKPPDIELSKRTVAKTKCNIDCDELITDIDDYFSGNKPKN